MKVKLFFIQVKRKKSREQQLSLHYFKDKIN